MKNTAQKNTPRETLAQYLNRLAADLENDRAHGLARDFRAASARIAELEQLLNDTLGTLVSCAPLIQPGSARVDLGGNVADIQAALENRFQHLD